VKTILTFILLIHALNINSQSNQLFSLALNIGAFAYGDNNIGPAVGIDIEARHNKFGLFLNSTGNFLLDCVGFRIIEFSVGPRWYVGNLEKINGTIETGLGYYISANNEVQFGGAFGINLGAGLNYPVSNKLDLSFKGKYHIYAEDYGNVYGGFYFSMRYYFNK
jgi:hypothetical protein